MEESKAKDCLKKLDPIDSLYFDVSVARHMIEEGKYDEADVWLDPNHALLELRRSLKQDFITADEYSTLEITIGDIKSSIKITGEVLQAMKTITELQTFLAVRTYHSFLKCMQRSSSNLGNPEVVGSNEELTVGYHVTKATAVPKILSEGLTPRVGPRTRQLLPIEPYEESVFVWPTLADAEEFKAIVEYFEEKNQWVILKIKTPTRFKHRIVKWGAGLAATEIRVLEKIPPSEIAVYEGSNSGLSSNPGRAEPLIPYWTIPAAFTLILVGAAFAGWVAAQLEGEA